MIVLGVVLLVLGAGLSPFAVYKWREEWKQWKESENKKCIVPLEMLFCGRSAGQFCLFCFSPLFCSLLAGSCLFIY